MRVKQPACRAFQYRWGGSSYCGWCHNELSEHAYLDATVYSSAGPFIEVGHSDDERVPNPAYRPEVAA